MFLFKGRTDNRKFKKMLKEEEPERILKNYLYSDLELTPKQLGIVIDLKNKKIDLKEALKQIKVYKKRKSE